jgi:hypothetical protein
MELFVHLPEYRVVVCKKCKCAIVGGEVKSHLQGKKHREVPRHLQGRKSMGLSKGEKQHIQQIVDDISQIPNLVQREEELHDFQFPPPSTKAIPALKLYKDGMKCKSCSHISRQRQKIQEHCRTKHDWCNDRKRGREDPEKRQIRKEHKGEDLPWIEKVYCQRFFRTRLASRFFEVAREEEQAMSEEEGQPLNMTKNVRRIVKAGLDRIAKKSRETINVTIHPWPLSHGTTRDPALHVTC